MDYLNLITLEQMMIGKLVFNDSHIHQFLLPLTLLFYLYMTPWNDLQQFACNQHVSAITLACQTMIVSFSPTCVTPYQCL